MSEKPLFHNTLQVAVVVKNREEAMKKYAEVYGLDGWKTYQFDPTIVGQMIVKDKLQDYAMLMGLQNIGRTNWELIEPLDDISIYAEFLREHGEGIHHVALATDSYDDTVAFFRKKGIGIAQSGTVTFNNVTYTYLDTQDALSATIELYSTPPDAEAEAGRAQNPIFTDVLKVAVVVKDLDRALENYASLCGLRGWQVREINAATATNMTVRGKHQDYATRNATLQIGKVQWELIQPLDDKSIFAEFLQQHGGGFHHVTLAVANYDQAMRAFQEKGIGTIQSYTMNDVTYTYLDSQATFSTIVEVRSGT